MGELDAARVQAGAVVACLDRPHAAPGWAAPGGEPGRGGVVRLSRGARRWVAARPGSSPSRARASPICSKGCSGRRTTLRRAPPPRCSPRSGRCRPFPGASACQLPQRWARRWGPLVAGVILLGWTGSAGEGDGCHRPPRRVRGRGACSGRPWRCRACSRCLRRVPQWAAGPRRSPALGARLVVCARAAEALRAPRRCSPWPCSAASAPCSPSRRSMDCTASVPRLRLRLSSTRSASRPARARSGCARARSWRRRRCRRCGRRLCGSGRSVVHIAERPGAARAPACVPRSVSSSVTTESRQATSRSSGVCADVLEHIDRILDLELVLVHPHALLARASSSTVCCTSLCRARPAASNTLRDQLAVRPASGASARACLSFGS